MPSNPTPQESSLAFLRIDFNARPIQQNIFRSNPLPHLILQQSKKIFLAMGLPLLIYLRMYSTSHLDSKKPCRKKHPPITRLRFAAPREVPPPFPNQTTSPRRIRAKHTPKSPTNNLSDPEHTRQKTERGNFDFRCEKTSP
jgi:hypothetical protein